MLQSTISYTTGIQANLLVQATATQLSNNSFFSKIELCTTANNAVKLPESPYINQYYTIRNDGEQCCQLFPFENGSINSLLDNIPFYIGAGCIVTLLPITNKNWHVTNRSGPALIDIGNIVGSFALPMNLIDNNVIIGSSSNDANTITLPLPETIIGHSVTFITKVQLNNILTFIGIPASGTKFVGNLTENALVTDVNYKIDILINLDGPIGITGNMNYGSTIKFTAVSSTRYLVEGYSSDVDAFVDA